MGALRRIAAPGPAGPRLPPTADRSAPRGRRPSSAFRHRQSIPQCQQPLAAEPGGVQFLVRRDDNLAVIDCVRRLAAQRDPVNADDVDAHEWVLLVDPAATAAGDPTDALVADQGQSNRDNLVALLS